MKTKSFLALFLFSAAMFPNLAHSEGAADFLSRKTAEVGKPAPAFQLQDLNGNPVNLADQAGKVVMVHFWSAQCPYVVRYEERLQSITSDYKDKGVVVLGINSNKTETPEQMKQTAAERKVNYPIALDPGNKVADQYGAVTTPHVYIIDAKGNLAYEGAVDDQGWNENNPVKKQYARETLDALLAGKSSPYTTTKTAGCTIKRA